MYIILNCTYIDRVEIKQRKRHFRNFSIEQSNTFYYFSLLREYDVRYHL